jgi:membrane dipeptidase
MTTRRGLLQIAMASAAMAVPASRALAARDAPVVFDALGEMRTVYTPALLDQILASGTRAIAVTVTDPKVEVAKSLAQTNADLDAYDRYYDAHPGHFIRAMRAADVDRAAAERKIAVFYNLQNSTPVEADLDQIATLRRRGVTSIQITYNDTNRSGSGCFVDNDPGLTAFGRELIARLEAERVLLDLSHAGMTTMAGAIAAAKRPAIISHTACKALWDHRRNTTDANMRAVADKGGLVGVTQIRTFLTDQRTDNARFYFDHIDHAVKVAGVDHVCIGSDRDHRVIPDTEEELKVLLQEEGSQIKPADWPLYLEGMNGPHRMTVVRDELKKRRYSQAQIDKLMGNNVRRLYREVVG